MAGFFHSGECSLLAHAVGLFQNKKSTSTYKYYLSSGERRFANFKAKCIISQERVEVKLSEMSPENIYQPWGIFCGFPPISYPLPEYLNASLTGY